jgi:hypothetical protein
MLEVVDEEAIEVVFVRLVIEVDVVCGLVEEDG